MGESLGGGCSEKREAPQGKPAASSLYATRPELSTSRGLCSRLLRHPISEVVKHGIGVLDGGAVAKRLAGRSSCCVVRIIHGRGHR